MCVLLCQKQCRSSTKSTIHGGGKDMQEDLYHLDVKQPFKLLLSTMYYVILFLIHTMGVHVLNLITR